MLAQWVSLVRMVTPLMVYVMKVREESCTDNDSEAVCASPACLGNLNKRRFYLHTN